MNKYKQRIYLIVAKAQVIEYESFFSKASNPSRSLIKIILISHQNKNSLRKNDLVRIIIEK